MAKNTLVRWHSPIWTNASLAASVAGEASDISNTDNISVHIKVGAGATGEFFIQASNIVDQTVVGTGANFYRGPGATDWVTIPLVQADGTTAQTLTVAGSALQYLVNLSNLAHSFIRVIYTRTSGTGTANVWVNGKSLSA